MTDYQSDGTVDTPLKVFEFLIKPSEILLPQLCSDTPRRSSIDNG